jgi:O-antigen/teichoic acid export membrane protein
LYGLVSFFATLQSLLFLLDAGLSATLRRELSAGEISVENNKIKYKLIRSVEFVFILLIVLIVFLSFFCASFIANKWLNLGNIDHNVAINAIRLMSISIAIQFLTNLYNGCLLGLEKQLLSNFYQIGWSILKNGCVIFVIWLIKSDILLFYLWFIFADIIYTFVLRYTLMRTLCFKLSFKWELHELYNLRKIFKYAIGILFISLISAINFQLDKIIISKYLPISDLGIYNLAYALSQIPVMFVTAFSIAIFPRFVFFYSTNDNEKLISLFKDSYKVLNIIAICIAVYICFYSYDLLLLWTRNIEIVNKASASASVLIIGSMFLAFQILPFNFILAKGVTKINVIFGIINIFILVPMLIFLVSKYGIVGAAVSWLIMQFLFTLFYNNYVYKNFINDGWLKWFFNDTILPLIFVIAISLLFYSIKYFYISNRSYIILFALLTGSITLIITLISFNRSVFTLSKRFYNDFSPFTKKNIS